MKSFGRFISFCLISLSAGPSAISAEESPSPRNIQVNGEAECKVVPDEVVLTLGVERNDMDLSKAKKENDEATQKIIAKAREMGVEAEKIQTDFLSIEPRYDSSYQKRDFLGYWVRKSIVVTLRDISKFETLLSGVLEAGANYVHGIQFRTTELRKHRDKAREMAMQAAREKAEALAKTLGQRIGRPISISEGYGGWNSSYNSWWGGRYGWAGQNAQNVSYESGSASANADSSLAPGQISVTAHVSVTFELLQ